MNKITNRKMATSTIYFSENNIGPQVFLILLILLRVVGQFHIALCIHTEPSKLDSCISKLLTLTSTRRCEVVLNKRPADRWNTSRVTG